jgi:hypothetical protein
MKKTQTKLERPDELWSFLVLELFNITEDRMCR